MNEERLEHQKKNLARIEFEKWNEDRLEKEKREEERIEKEMREEEKREEERKQELENLEQERIRQEKQLQVKTRLNKFKISRKEAQLIFGRTWIKRLEKPDEEFIKEAVRVTERICESELYRQKISVVMEKVLDMVDICMHEIWGKMQGWDDIEYEDWEDTWQEVRNTWKNTRHLYQEFMNDDDPHSYDQRDDSPNRIDFEAFEILGLSKSATIKQIKTQYRKLILKYHPDRNPTSEAVIMTKKIISAYGFLRARGFLKKDISA